MKFVGLIASIGCLIMGPVNIYLYTQAQGGLAATHLIVGIAVTIIGAVCLLSNITAWD